MAFHHSDSLLGPRVGGGGGGRGGCKRERAKTAITSVGALQRMRSHMISGPPCTFLSSSIM